MDQFEVMALIREYARDLVSKNPHETDTVSAINYKNIVRKMNSLCEDLDTGPEQPFGHSRLI